MKLKKIMAMLLCAIMMFSNIDTRLFAEAVENISDNLTSEPIINEGANNSENLTGPEVTENPSEEGSAEEPVEGDGSSDLTEEGDSEEPIEDDNSEELNNTGDTPEGETELVGILEIENPDEMSGSGTKDDPYRIENAEHLKSIADDLTAYYLLSGDIDLSDKEWEPIANFSGVLEGNGYKIKNLYVNKETIATNAGLFAKTTGATIKQVVLENITVIGIRETGGLVGNASSTSIEECAVIGTSLIKVTGGTYTNVNAGSIVGGLVSDNSIKNSFSTARVEGASLYYTGGFVGNSGPSNNRNVILNSYYSGDCFYSGTRYQYLNGLSYSDYLDVINSYVNTFDNYYKGSKIAGEIGKTTSEMQDKNMYQDWDFDEVWEFDNSFSYPYLKAIKNFDPNAYFTEITNPEELSAIRDNLYGNYILSSDIDLEGIDWEPIVGFKGTLNGNGYGIKNLYINTGTATTNAGLFASVIGARINQVVLENITVIGIRETGGLIGNASGTFIEECAVIGTSLIKVTGGTYTNVNAGSIVGGLASDNSIKNSFSTARVEGASLYYTGGFVGNSGPSNNRNVILNSYYSGDCFYSGTRYQYLNGLSYSDYLDVINSYVNTFDSYYKGSKIAGKIGKTTLEMQDKNTYQDWDFDGVWGFDDNFSYPYLKSLKNFGPNAWITKITNPEELSAIRDNLYGYYILSADIDLKDVDWEPIVGFSGLLDGNGHKIKNLYVNTGTATTNAGLFASTFGARIKQVVLENIMVIGIRNCFESITTGKKEL